MSRVSPLPFVFRLATTEDAALLSQLWIDTFRQAYDDVHTPENLDAYCTQNFSVVQAKTLLSHPTTICKIAYKDELSLGFYVLNLSPCPLPLQGTSAELKQIYILKQAYRTGLGRALYEDAIKELRDREIEWVWLSVSDWNTRAQAFYEKQKFNRLGAGPIFEVGTDRLPSSILAKKVV